MAIHHCILLELVVYDFYCLWCYGGEESLLLLLGLYSHHFGWQAPIAIPASFAKYTFYI
jgi:hypothetical protein